MAGGLVNRSLMGRLAPQPSLGGGVSAPAGGAYAALSPRSTPRAAVSAPRAVNAPQGVRQAPQAVAAGGAPRAMMRARRPAWLDAQYLSDLAGLSSQYTQQTSPVREQLSQLGFSTGGFTPYEAAVRDIGNAFQSNVYGMDSSLAQRGILNSGARGVGTTRLGLERSTNLANANQEMGPAAMQRFRRQIQEMRQGFNQSKLAARATARERLLAKRHEAALSRQQLAALRAQIPSQQHLQNLMNQALGYGSGGGGGGQNRGSSGGGGFHIDTGRIHGYAGLVDQAMNRLQNYGAGQFKMPGGAVFSVDAQGHVRKQPAPRHDYGYGSYYYGG